jgi:hypothetical protein
MLAAPTATTEHPEYSCSIPNFAASTSANDATYSVVWQVVAARTRFSIAAHTTTGVRHRSVNLLGSISALEYNVPFPNDVLINRLYSFTSVCVASAILDITDMSLCPLSRAQWAYVSMKRVMLTNSKSIE